MTSCKRMTVTAIGVDADGKVATATNYNENECRNEIGNCGCTHAEMALLEKMPNPKVVTVTHAPCFSCAKALHSAGVSAVYYHLPYRLTDGIDYLRSVGIQVARISEKGIEGSLSLDMYQSQAARTINPDQSLRERLIYYCFGDVGESGEVIDHLKKHLFHGHKLDINELELEMGDKFWYLALLATTLGIPLSRIAVKNIEKLQERYPNGYSKEDSLKNR